MSDVTIKPLEWQRTPSCPEIGHDPYDSATGFGGHYIVEERKAGHFDLWLPEQSVGIRHASAEAAKAAAQADYEVRILSCLDRRAPAAPATPETEACHCIGNWGPNPDCGRCGGDGDAAPATPARDDLRVVEECDCCVDGLQADGETPCPYCTKPQISIAEAAEALLEAHKYGAWLVGRGRTVEQVATVIAALRDAGGTDGAPHDAQGVWRRISQDRQPLLQEGYTAVRAVSPGIWEVQGYGPATAHAGGTDGN